MKKSISLKLKTVLIVAALVTIVITIFVGYQYFRQRKELEETIESQITTNDLMIFKIINLHVDDRQKTVNTALNLAHSIFYKGGGIIENKSNKLDIIATNQLTKKQHHVKVNSWMLDGIELHSSFSMVDTIKELSVETVTIFQKIDEGYLRISTNVMKLDGTRAIGTFIPNDSPVIKKIESGETYVGRAYVVNAWYLTAYEPIIIDGEIKGILYVGVKEKDFDEIGGFFVNKGFETGQSFLVGENGRVLVKKEIVGENIQDEDYFLELKNNESLNGHFEYMDKNGVNKLLFYRYNEKVKAYIIFTVESKEFYAPLRKLFWSSLIGGLLRIIIISVFLILFLTNQIFKPIEKIIILMKKISKKEIGFTIENSRTDEIGELYDSMNEINVNFKEILLKISTSSSSFIEASKQLALISLSISESSNEQSATTEEVSSSMEEIIATVQSNTDKSENTNEISSNAAKKCCKIKI